MIRKKKLIIASTILLFTVVLINQNFVFFNKSIENLNQIQTSDDSYEFNNYYFDSILIEEGNYTNLECYDDDYFQLRVNSGYRLHVEIFFENSIGNLDLELYDSSNALVNSSISLVDDVESLYYTVSTGILYTIHVFYVDNPNIYNLSVYYSIAPGQKLIEVNDPLEGVTWNEGSTYDITWTTLGNITDVRIELIQSHNKMQIEYISFSTENDGLYSWVVPDYIMTRDDYYIRVKEQPGTVFGISDIFSINNPSFPYSTLEVITPNATTIWQNGSSYEITWDNTSFPTLVDLFLYTGNSFYSNIALGVDNNGSYIWMIPDSIVTDDNYRIRILSNTTYVPREFSEYFWIVNTDPSEKTLIIESPKADVEWIAGNQYEISWFTSGDMENVTIQYQLSVGSWITINSSIENIGSYLWTIPTSIESSMDYVIRVNEYGGFESAISEEFTINNPNSGKIYVSSPSSGYQWHNGTSYNITWFSLGTIDKVNISLYNLYGFVYTIASNIDNYDNYSWKIPNNLTGGLGYYINISDSSDLDVNGISDFFHLICDGIPPSSINILDPGISVNWIVTNSYDITWEWTGDTSNVTIELWDVSTGFIQTIGENVPNTGSYSWYVPISPFLPTDNDYYFVIYNPENCVPFDTSAVFTITNDHAINVINPTASVVWEIGKEYEITWTTTGSISNVGITLLYFGVPTLTITSNTTNDGSFLWTIPGSVIPHTDDYYRIYIYEVDWEYLVNDYSDAFSISSTIPSITITSPNSNSIWVKGNTYEIKWSHTGDIDYVDILLEYNSTLLSIVSSTSNDGSYSWVIPDNVSDYNNYYIIIRDSNNPNINDTSDGFSIFSTLPSITITNPDSNSIWVKGNTYEIKWSYTGDIDHVDILLEYNSTLLPIVSSTSNDGSYLWAIPDNVSDYNNYYIIIQDSNNPNINDTSDGFSIISKIVGAPFPFELILTVVIISSATGVGIITAYIIIRKRKLKA